VELLVVLAVLAVLATIIPRVGDGVRERARLDRARGELAALAEALERYRAAHGDYPRVREGEDDALRLWRALEGLDLPDGRRASAPRALLAGGVFELGDPGSLRPLGGTEVPVAAVYLDPWGQPYRYAYRRGAADATWRRAGFLLLSTGPSGAAATEAGRREAPRLPPDGRLDEAYFNPESADAPTHDNIFATH
jgi:general secretion pathway protein G